MSDVFLRFRYHDGEPTECPDLDGLADDERAVVLDVLDRHFNGIEPGAYKFDSLDTQSLSVLERRRRERPGSAADAARGLLLAFRSTARPPPGATQDDLRYLRVRDTLTMIVGEICELRREFGLTGGPIVGTCSVLTKLKRTELVDHLMLLDLTNPESPYDRMAKSLGHRAHMVLQSHALNNPPAPPTQSDGPTQVELLQATREGNTPAISATLFRELIRESGIRRGKRGEKGRCFTQAEVQALIDTAHRLGKQDRDRIARCWARYTGSNS